MYDENIKVLLSISAEDYPFLYGELSAHGATYRAKLINIITALEENHHTSADTIDGKEWRFLSVDYLVKSYGGSAQTWHNAIIYSLCCGLLERRKPNKQTTQKPLAYSQKRAQTKGKKVKAVSWYCVPEYNETILNHVEQVVKQFKNYGIKRKDISKDAVIMALGQTTANKIYWDGRQKSQLNAKIQRELTFRINKTISSCGYAVPAEIIQATSKTCFKKYYSKTLEEIRQSTERIWRNRKQKILDDSNAVYRRPTREEKQNIQRSDNCWLIFSKEEKV